MKHQQVVVDYWTMIKTSFLCLLLAFFGYILIKMIQTVFLFPNHLKSNQQRLEELAKRYGKDMSEEERVELEKLFQIDDPLLDEPPPKDKDESEEKKKEL